MPNSIAAKQIYLVYVEMSDEEIVELAQQGDQYAIEYLVDKYKNFVRAKARSYFLIGADKEDIIQEGMIGLLRQFVIIRWTNLPHLERLQSCVLLDKSLQQ